jgi:hypothetical protein
MVIGTSTKSAPAKTLAIAVDDAVPLVRDTTSVLVVLPNAETPVPLTIAGTAVALESAADAV